MLWLILSRRRIEKILEAGKSIKNHAVISFCDTDLIPINFEGKTDRIFIIKIDDISKDDLMSGELTNAKFFNQADALAEFIYKAKNDGYNFICQCEYGQSRSAGCAAAILQHFEQSGIKVFADYKYYPNKLIYYKVFDALEGYKKKQ